MKRNLLFLLFISAFCACKKEKEPVTQPVQPPVNTETLKSVATFPVGAAIDPNLATNNIGYRTTVKTEYNSITTENTAKLNWIHPQQNNWNFSGTDQLIAFAQANSLRVHGHTLIWHAFEEVDWVKNFTGDSAAWEAMFKNHIQTIVTRYKGKVKSWDVVNEAFTDEGKLRLDQSGNAGQSPNGSIWARKLGSDYIARAFQYAHEADPDALLFYNEYGLENQGIEAKLNAVVNMINTFKSRGIPIHGVGTQTHIGVSAPDAGITNALQKLASTGLLVHISELDILVSDWTNNPNLVYTPQLQEKQSNKYQFIAQTYKASVPPAQRYGITTWNVGDADSWIRTYIKFTDWPLPFDERYSRKNAYQGYLKGLKL